MQYSLFGKHPLFDERTIERRRREWRELPIVGLDAISEPLVTFSRELRQRQTKNRKETSLEQKFNASFFGDLLGYKFYPGVDGRWTAWPKPPSAITRLPGEPDLLLGISRDEDFETVAVVELKKPGTILDAPQPSYNNRTPVEQAFEYGRRLATCRWIVVTDMHFVRLYSIESPDAYHEIDLWALGVEGERDTLAEAVHLLSFENFVEHGADSPTARLLTTVREEQAQFRDAFYKVYSDIRADLLEAIQAWANGKYERAELVAGVQRLLDRLLFIYFCEDHPDRLLRHRLLEMMVEGAVQQPGPSVTKAYDSVKQLFRDLDEGVSTEHWKIPKYNGELFKPHEIVDSLSIPDSLNTKRYTWRASGDKLARTVNGVFGLHVFDFWRELDRDLLGNLFERSIGDLTALAHGGRPDARKAFGIFYTSTRLARFVARSAVETMLAENQGLSDALRNAATGNDIEREQAVSLIFELVKKYRVADLACGSGVFLTAAFEALLAPYRKGLEAVRADGMTHEMRAFRQSEVLKEVIFGIDLLPQAIELAKLSLWLTAARRNEPSAELTKNFLTGDALDAQRVVTLKGNAGGKFDLVLGNPPWGGEYSPDFARQVLSEVGLEGEGFDSWEIFLGLAWASLKEGGRFGLLVPDTFFSAEKKRTRLWLLQNSQLEKVYSIGADWFTNEVRMGTVVLQGVKRQANPGSQLATIVIAGKERLQAQQGKKPLEQLEKVGAIRTPQELFLHDPQAQIQVLASSNELGLIAKIERNSHFISEITERARGEEINADGLLWRCGNCGAFTVPGEKEKGGGYKSKRCPKCDATLTIKDVFPEALVSSAKREPYNTEYIDGGALTRRYENPVRRFIRTDLVELNPPLKAASVFRGPKILIRQAGVGIVATLVDDDARCPQSVYLYRVLPNFAEMGYSNEFVLGCLVSRTMNYICMKKFAEIDPAKAFAKLTHARIAQFPVPKLETASDFDDANEIVKNVRRMLNGGEHGGSADLEIEYRLRRLWGISGDEGRFINGFFSMLPDGQAVLDLFPKGAPPRVPFPTDAGQDDLPI